MRLLIIGASGHAKVVADAVLCGGQHELVGFIAGRSSFGAEWFGRPLLGDDQSFVEIARHEGVEAAVVAIGDNWTRAQVVQALARRVPHLIFPPVVHPSAVIGSGAHIGNGSVILAGAVVGPDAAVGEHVIVNTRASVDHDCTLEQFSSIAPGATLGGNVAVGEYGAVSIGATIAHGVTIGRHTVVGAGAAVVRDIPADCVAYGVPARPVRARAAGEPYL